MHKYLTKPEYSRQESICRLGFCLLGFVLQIFKLVNFTVIIFFMLIVFEMAEDLKLMAIFESFFFKEFCIAIIIYVLHFQPDRILRLN